MSAAGSFSQANQSRVSAVKYDEFTLRNVFERITDAFVAFDDQWNYIYLNNKAANIIGRRPEDLIGKNIWKEFPEKRQHRFYMSFFTAMAEQKTTTQEGYCPPVGAWLHATLYPSPEGLSVYLQDITPQKKAAFELEESREKYRQIVETAQEGIWLIDENNKTVFVNQKMCEILECTADEILGKTHHHFLDEEGQKLSAASLNSRRNGTVENIDKQFITKRGRRIWTNMSANPIFNQQGEYKGALAMISDISDKVKLQQQLVNEQLNKQREILKAVLIAQEKERNHLGQELHDNVNQLLAGTKLFLVAATAQHAELKKLIDYPLQLIDTSIDEIRSLCKQMVTPVKNIDLKALIQRLIDDIDQCANIKTAFSCSAINASLPDDLKLSIYRIIQEQINNILKHAAAKSIIVSIKEENNIINVSIEDDGKGFTLSSQRKGIGISNMINRIESYNGQLEIQTSKGCGCKILVSIPV